MWTAKQMVEMCGRMHMKLDSVFWFCMGFVMYRVALVKVSLGLSLFTCHPINFFVLHCSLVL